jgi:hypothetical protein
MKKHIVLAVVATAAMAITLVGCGVKITNIAVPESAMVEKGESILITPLPKCAIPLKLKAKKVTR